MGAELLEEGGRSGEVGRRLPRFCHPQVDPRHVEETVLLLKQSERFRRARKRLSWGLDRDAGIASQPRQLLDGGPDGHLADPHLDEHAAPAASGPRTRANAATLSMPSRTTADDPPRAAMADSVSVVSKRSQR